MLRSCKAEKFLLTRASLAMHGPHTYKPRTSGCRNSDVMSCPVCVYLHPCCVPRFPTRKPDSQSCSCCRWQQVSVTRQPCLRTCVVWHFQGCEHFLGELTLCKGSSCSRSKLSFIWNHDGGWFRLQVRTKMVPVQPHNTFATAVDVEIAGLRDGLPSAHVRRLNCTSAEALRQHQKSLYRFTYFCPELSF